MKIQDQKIGRVALTNAGIEDPNSQAIVWEPGDGYRYAVLFNKLPDSLIELVGGTNAHFLVTYYNGQVAHSWAMIDGGHHSIDYVAARFGLKPDQSTAAYLTALLNMTLGKFEYGVELYEAAKERWC